MTHEQMIKALENGISLRREKINNFFKVLEHLNEKELFEINNEIQDTEQEIEYLTIVSKILKKI